MSLGRPVPSLQVTNDKLQRTRGILSLRPGGQSELRDLICDFTNILTGHCLHILFSLMFLQRGERRDPSEFCHCRLSLMMRNAKSSRKKRQFVPGYYFANDFNDAVNSRLYFYDLYFVSQIDLF